MKILIVVIALIGVGCAAATVEEDFKDFIALIPAKQIKDIVVKYQATDVEFQTAIAYLKGTEFSSLVTTIHAKEPVKALEKYLFDAGINIDVLWKYIEDIFTNVRGEVKSQSGSLKEFLKEVKKAVPTAKIFKMFLDKMKNSPAFQDCFAKVSSEEAHQLVEEVRGVPEVQSLTAKLMEMDVEVERYIKIVYALFGWK